jgi:predicted nucleic-acid-binding protein
MNFKLRHHPQFRIEDHSEMWSSLREHQARADFADALTGAVNRGLGCSETVTFDRKAGHRSGS